MIELKDLTITIPVKIDHPDRSRNLKIVVDFLTRNLNTNIIVCEQDTEEVPNILKGYDFKYLTHKRSDNLIHRTFQLNYMAKAADTPFIANYDADVLVLPDLYHHSVNLLREGKASLVLPYAGPCYDVPVRYHDAILESGSLDCVGDITKTGGLMNPNSVGGAIFWNKDDFIKGGMENERFISWGFEDNERFYRFNTLGYPLLRSPGNLYHLNHFRTPNSNHTHKFYNNNKSEYDRIRRMNRMQLQNEVSTWDWCR
jgi:hypothetical protein